MAVDKLRVVVWIFAAILVSGLCMIFASRVVQVPLSVVHKLLAVLFLILLVRNAGVLRAPEATPALLAALSVFAVACLAAFGTGVVQSIPACASVLWLNLHRVAAAIAAVACFLAARLVSAAGHT